MLCARVVLDRAAAWTRLGVRVTRGRQPRRQRRGWRICAASWGAGATSTNTLCAFRNGASGHSPQGQPPKHNLSALRRFIFSNVKGFSGHHGTHFCKQRAVFCDVLRGLAGVAHAGFAASAAAATTASAASAALGAFFVVARGLAVVVPLLSCILEAPRSVVEVLEADGVGIFLLDSRGVAALLV